MTEYKKFLASAKDKLIDKWTKLDKKILNSPWRLKAGWRVDNLETKTIKFLEIGEVRILRRKYINIYTKKYAFLLDEHLGWKKNSRLSEEVWEQIIKWHKQGKSGVNIWKDLHDMNVKISKQTVSNAFKRIKKKDEP